MLKKVKTSIFVLLTIINIRGGVKLNFYVKFVAKDDSTNVKKE